jgi:hypothetical protein
MGPKKSALPDAPQPALWPPVEGATTKQAVQDAYDQIKGKGYYAPEHGSLPGPHELASRQSWPDALQTRSLTDLQVPGDVETKGKTYFPFPHRRGAVKEAAKGKKELPITDPRSPWYGVWNHDDEPKRLDIPTVSPGRDVAKQQRWPLEPGVKVPVDLKDKKRK